MNRTGVGFTVICAAVLSSAACSEADPGIVGEGPARMDGGSGTTIDGSSVIATGDASGDKGGGIGTQCAGSISTPEKVPLDLFIMLDQSGSMSFDTGNGHSKWEEVVKALGTFISRPDVGGIGVGLQYFGLRDPAGTCAVVDCRSDVDCGAGCGPCVLPSDADAAVSVGVCQGVTTSDDSCNAALYATAEVPIAPLPGNAAAISASLARHRPFSGTPTLPALQGSIDYVTRWAAANPTHIAVNVFATDGEPAECDTDLQHIENVAKAGVDGMPSVRTFVIGIHGENEGVPGMTGSGLDNLHRIAAAGGTDKAFLVTNNTAAQFLAALNKIRVTTLSCAYFIPKPTMGAIDVDKVNVEYTPGGADTPMTIPRVKDKSACGDRDGWYYDDPLHPTQLVMCDATCQLFTSDYEGTIQIQLGCATIVR
jgi:hypothetical protein